jgi:protein-S-isoprenylcysteine O-methyltransferase Ste14
VAVKACAIACYLVALVGAAALGALLLLLGLDQLPERTILPDPWPWVVDIAWLSAFAVQHSGMARAGFKHFGMTIVPDYLQCSVYAALSGLLLVGLALTWQPVGGEPFWRLPLGLVVVPLAAAAGMAAVNLRFDHAGLFGLRQVWERGRAPAPERLLVHGPYRYVRHPLMACLLVFLWAHPVMTPTLALLAGGLTVYIVLGIALEERDLLRRFGPAYADYRRRVPALLPWRPPAPPAAYPAIGGD